MSNKREREKRREERLQEETKVGAGERRTRLLQFGAGAVFLVIVAVVVLIVVNGSSSSGGDAQNLKEVSSVDSLVNGIPQEGLVLGDSKAKVELVEYGDLQCPVCKAYSEEILPPVIENQIKNGQAKLTFRNFTIIGPQSAPAGAAALAAGAQGRGWNYLELFYRNQGKENSGYAGDEFLTAVAKGAGVKDIAQWQKERAGKKFTGEVTATTEQAQDFGFTGTPSFAIKGPNSNGTELLGTPGSPDEIEEAIEKAS
ncbi:MAG TPA: thioredoxin domain-containing protein [Solirubrobacterales bacterium]|jgi:protein-disulfide isomerase|nr:thioredoxin domain-containing protein [Solirubrobacterales bacterium]